MVFFFLEEGTKSCICCDKEGGCAKQRERVDATLS